MKQLIKAEEAAMLAYLGGSCMDRAMGYGLKYFSGFQDTHLGEIGKGKQV